MKTSANLTYLQEEMLQPHYLIEGLDCSYERAKTRLLDFLATTGDQQCNEFASLLMYAELTFSIVYKSKLLEVERVECCEVCYV